MLQKQNRVYPDKPVILSAAGHSITMTGEVEGPAVRPDQQPTAPVVLDLIPEQESAFPPQYNMDL